MAKTIALRTSAGPRIGNRGADLAVKVLLAQGATRIMGLTGGAIMDFMDALAAEKGLELQPFQTEGGACWAAMGHARTTGKVGVCAVTSGPGATNTVTPLADAHRDNVPLLVITGQVPGFARDTDAFQETNITKIAATITKKAFYLDCADDIQCVFEEAFRIALEGRPGPVLIDFTKDAQQAVVDSPVTEPSPSPTVPDVENNQLEKVVELLSQARRPVVIAGYGVVLAGVQEALRQFLDITQCPLVHTLPGKAAVPSSDPRNFGMLGMHGFYVANWMVHEADLLISFGSRFDDRITGRVHQFAPRAGHLVHFDIAEDQINKVLPERKTGVVGDLRSTLPALNRQLTGIDFDFEEWHRSISDFSLKHPPTYRSKPDRLQAPYALQVLNRVVAQIASDGRKVIYTTEVGDHQQWSGQYLELQSGWQFLTSSGQGAMGSGVPMAIGAQMAHPEALVVCIAGDGSLRLSEAELETISNCGLPIKILLVNNGGYGIVRMWNHFFYEGRETGVVKQGKDWTLLARSNGFNSDQVDRVTDPGEVESVLRRSLSHSGPHLVELVTPYEECLPRWPPGSSFEEIILDVENIE